jgi:hypothetical protein
VAKIARKIGKAEWKKLPEAVQELYSAKGDDYVLDADDAEELKGALDKKAQEAKDLKARLDAVKDIDPAEYKRLSEEAQKATRQRDLDEKNYQKIIDEEKATAAAEIKKRDERTSRLMAELEAERVDGELTRAAASYKGASIDLILPAAKPYVKLREIGGKMRAVVLDDKGEPRTKADAKNVDDLMGPADLVAEMRNDKRYAAAFPASTPHNPILRIAPTQSSGLDSSKEVNEIAAQITAGAQKLTS